MYLEDFVGASAVFDEALKIRPDDPTLLVSNAKAKMELSEFLTAEFFLQRAIDVAPGNGTAWELRAELGALTGNTPAVLEARQRLIQYNPDEWRRYHDLIRLLSQLERFEQALDVSDNAVVRFGEGRSVLESRLSVLEALPASVDLEQTLEKLIAFDPTNLDYRLKLAAHFVRQSLWPDAEIAFRSALDLDPENLEIGESLGAVLSHQGRDQEGIALVENIQQALIDERVGDATLDLSTPEGRASATTSELRAFLDAHQEDVAVLSELAGRLYSDQDFLASASIYEQIISGAPRELNAWTNAIDSYVKAGAPDDALRLTDQALALFPGFTPLLILNATALVEVGRTEEAISIIQQLRERVSDADQIRSLEELLERIEAM